METKVIKFRNELIGIKDKTGKDIREGNIVLHDSLPGAKEGLPIVYEDCKFIIKGKCESDNIILGSNGRSILVIGSVYDNNEGKL